MASTTSPHNFIYNGDFAKLIRESGFIFESRKNNSRIDWNEIRAIDIERLVVERDFRTIDNHVYEVLNCQLDTEFDLRILDSGFVKLFRLAQLSVEYLLQCRRQLDIIISSTKEEIKQLREEKEYLKRQMNSKEEDIRKLNNKMRKRHKSAGLQKYDEISQFLKNLVLNGSTNTTLSVGEQNLAALYKCIHCEKLFLNHFFLQAHITRRHSNAITVNDKVNNEDIDDENNQALPQDIDYKKMTEKLYREIEEMRERLSVAEKRHFDEFLKLSTKNDEVQKEDIESNEKSEINQNPLITQSTSKKINDSEVEVNQTENNFTKEMFEEWKKQEQVKYASEMEVLKSQLFESLNQIKGNIVEPTEKNDKDESNEKLTKITATLKKQEEEVMLLKEQLTHKAITKDTEIASKLEVQEKFWKSKVQSLEEQYIHTINELKSSMKLQINESQMIQQQYQNKIESMEKNLKQQLQILEVQSQKLENLESTKISSSEAKDHIQRLPQNIPVHKRQNLFLNESQESLPPYEDNTETNAQVIVHNKYSKSLKNKFDQGNDSSSESSSDFLKEKVKREENKSKSIQQLSKKPLSPKKLFVDKIQDKIVKNIHSEQSPKKLLKNKNEIKAPRNKKKKSEKNTKKENNNINYETDSDLEEQKQINVQKSKKGKNDLKNEYVQSNENIFFLKPNITKAVKKDLKLLVKKRLQNVGIQSNSKGISSDDYKKGVKYMNHKQQMMTKQYHGYNKYRKSIVKNLEEKLKQLDMSERTSTSSILEYNKSSPFKAMGSLIANVKNKAMNIVRSRENLKFDPGNISLKQPKITENMVNTSTPEKLSAKSILAMLDQRDVTDTAVIESKPVKNSNRESVSDDSDISEDSSNESYDNDDGESEYSDPNKIESRKILTTAISHMPSASIENLLNSPVRRPTSLQPKEKEKISSPVKTVEANKVTVPKSEIQLHSPGRFSKSEVNDNSMSESNVTPSESETDEEIGTIKSFPARKAASEDNVSVKKAVISPKGVLKSVASASSLTKKKVLFDLDTKQESVSDITYTQKDSSLDDILKMKINVWDASEETLDSTIDLEETINLSTKQSPKIAEISKIIQSQLSGRNIKPPAGSVNTMLQIDSIHNSPEKLKDENHNKQPVPAPRASAKDKNKVDSDLELSDWSIDDLVNMK